MTKITVMGRLAKTILEYSSIVGIHIKKNCVSKSVIILKFESDKR